MGPKIGQYVKIGSPIYKVGDIVKVIHNANRDYYEKENGKKGCCEK